MEHTNPILFCLGMLGILIHNLVKIDKINRKQDGYFRLLPFVRLEWPSISMSLCVLMVCVIAKMEIQQLEYAGKWLGLSFVTIGYMAQSLIYGWMGRAEKKLNL